MSFYSMPFTPDRVEATEARLEAIYAAARYGLKGDSLALRAGLTPAQYRKLHEFDPLVEIAEMKGRADGEFTACEPCAGSGAKPGSKPKTCATCAGHGRVRAQQGFFAIERTCPRCGGSGKLVLDPCKSCNGHGQVRRQRTLQVRIPPGVDDGARIRLSGEGDAGQRGGPRGDLYFLLKALLEQPQGRAHAAPAPGAEALAV
jgi:hypothetical protein